jgi:hypothetical protein
MRIPWLVSLALSSSPLAGKVCRPVKTPPSKHSKPPLLHIKSKSRNPAEYLHLSHLQPWLLLSRNLQISLASEKEAKALRADPSSSEGRVKHLPIRQVL